MNGLAQQLTALAGRTMMMVWLPSLMLGATGQGQDVPVRPGGCVYGHWTTAQPLEVPVSTLSATRIPIAALGYDDGTRRVPAVRGYVVGVVGYEAVELERPYPWKRTWPPQLRALRLDGSSVGSPSGAFLYAYPRAALDRGGVLHVLWGDTGDTLPRDPRRYGNRGPVLRALWYARWRSGRWSTPQRIYTARQIHWDEFVASALIVDAAQGLHVAFAAIDSVGSALVHLSSDATDPRVWRASVSRPENLPTYVALAAGGSRTLALAFVSTLTSPVPRDDALFVIRSLDNGASWSQPRLVTRETEEPALEPHVFFRGQTVELLWTAQPVGRFTDGRVWHATLAADGTDLAPRSALTLSGATTGSRAAMDACGTLHLVLKEFRHVGGPEGRSELAYARFAQDHWTALEYPFPIPSGHPSMVAIGDALHLFWNQVPRFTPGDVPVSTVLHAVLPITH
jgi:hypothetical protein